MVIMQQERYCTLTLSNIAPVIPTDYSLLQVCLMRLQALNLLFGRRVAWSEDSVYEALATLAEDGEISPRNWLHRYHIAGPLGC